MMTLDPLIHDTFNIPIGTIGDFEKHSVIRTENGGYYYADDVSEDDHIAEAHAEIVRRVNAYPELVNFSVSRPMDSAPLDGTHILAHNGDGHFPPVVVHFFAGSWYVSKWPNDCDNIYFPQKWWALPGWKSNNKGLITHLEDA